MAGKKAQVSTEYLLVIIVAIIIIVAVWYWFSSTSKTAMFTGARGIMTILGMPVQLEPFPWVY